MKPRGEGELDRVASDRGSIQALDTPKGSLNPRYLNVSVSERGEERVSAFPRLSKKLITCNERLIRRGGRTRKSTLP